MDGIALQFENTKSVVPPEPSPEDEGVIERGFAPLRLPLSFWFEFVSVCLLGGLVGCFCVGYVKAITAIPQFWYTANNSTFPNDPNTLSYAQGQTWWIAVGTACGVFTGAVKAIANVDELPSFITDLRVRHVHLRLCIVSLLCALAGQFAAVPMGPEAGLGATGALIGQLWADGIRRIIPYEPLRREIHTSIFCFYGAVAALSPLLPTPFISMILCAELAGPVGRTKEWHKRSYMHMFSLMATAATCSYAVYFAILGVPILNVPGRFALLQQSDKITAWDFSIGMLFGIMGAVLALAYFIICVICKIVFGILTKVFDRINRRVRIFLNCAIGGTLFGVFNYVFPMTAGSGDFMITPIVANVTLKKLDAGLLVASTFMKMVSFWVSSSSGMVGGVFFPTLVTGTMMAEAFHLWTGVSEVLAVSCGFIALAAAFIPVPTTLIMLSFLVFVLGQQGMFPIFTTVFTAYLLFTGVGIARWFTELKGKLKRDRDAEEENGMTEEQTKKT